MTVTRKRAWRRVNPKSAMALNAVFELHQIIPEA
jgi:hypothetical protein